MMKNMAFALGAGLLIKSKFRARTGETRGQGEGRGTKERWSDWETGRKGDSATRRGETGGKTWIIIRTFEKIKC